MKLLRSLHRWAGFVLAAYVALIAVTGTALVFRAPMERAVFPALGEPMTAAQREAWPTALTRIENQFEGQSLRLVKFPQTGANAFRLWFSDETQALADPTTGALIARWHWYQNPADFLHELHVHLLLAETGEKTSGFLALALLTLIFAGLTIWWPRRRRFRLGQLWPAANTRSAWLRSHQTFGVLFALPCALIIATGIGMVFYGTFSHWLGVASAPEPASVTSQTGARQSWGNVLAATETALPQARPVFYQPQAGPEQIRQFRAKMPGEWHPNGRSVIRIDAISGQVISARNAENAGRAERFMNALYPLHAGGLPLAGYRYLLALIGLALFALTAGGCISYFAPRRARRS